jgi:3-oxoacyl-[acyl-carrier-protein] synthase-3
MTIGLHGPVPVGIYDIEHFLPETILTSEEISVRSGLDKQTMENKLGINSLHVAADDEAVSDLAVAASERLLRSTAFPRGDVDGIIICTQNPDYKLPTTACIVQNRLALRKDCLAFDINQGCSGYPYSLAVGASLIASGICENVVLTMSEAYSKVVSYKDKTVCGLFGDGAAATLLRRTPKQNAGFLAFHFGTDGSGFDRLIVPAGGSRLPVSERTREMVQDAAGDSRSLEHIRMHGRDIFEFMDREVPASVKAALTAASLSLDDVKLFVFHQANKFMLEFLFRRMGLKSDRTIICMEETGNTVSASIPIALKRAMEQGRIHSGDIIVVCGFGVGLSWATAVLRWSAKEDWNHS